jgi:hypothetical protein
MTTANSLSWSFKKAVELWIFEAIERDIKDFNHLVLSLPSVDPTYVLRTLRRLRRTCPEHSSKIAKLMLTAQPEPSSLSSIYGYDTLPPPHPLDYDWRFSEVALERLLQNCIETTSVDDTIVLMGTPSLFQFIHQHSISQRTVLLDSNKSLSGRLGHTVNGSEAMFIDLLPKFGPNKGQVALGKKAESLAKIGKVMNA